MAIYAAAALAEPAGFSNDAAIGLWAAQADQQYQWLEVEKVGGQAHPLRQPSLRNPLSARPFGQNLLLFSKVIVEGLSTAVAPECS
jgi:hypothetical protein